MDTKLLILGGMAVVLTVGFWLVAEAKEGALPMTETLSQQGL